jgi:hypothetical protein
MIIENDKVVLVDLDDVSSATFAGTCTSCGGENSYFSRKMGDLYYINVSANNSGPFTSNAKASFDPKGKILPGTVKVYTCRKDEKPPVFVSNTLSEVEQNITFFYNAFRTTDTALDADLVSKMALAMKEYYVFGDTKKKCEEQMYKDFPTKIYQSKAFGPLLEKWTNLRFPVSFYKQAIKDIRTVYTPDINITCKPMISMCPDGSNATITVVKKDGTTETYCKSALIVINRSSDFGYRINKIVTGDDLENTALSNWSEYLSANSSAYQQGILTRAEAALNSTLPNRVITYKPAGENGAIFRFRLSNSLSNVFSIQVAIPIGSGPEFGQNWFYTPVTTFAVSIPAIARMYNQYQNLLANQRALAEARRTANNAAIINPDPQVTTPPTTIDYNVDNPVNTPPEFPVNPNITDPINNATPDGTYGGNSGAFDIGADQ